MSSYRVDNTIQHETAAFNNLLIFKKYQRRSAQPNLKGWIYPCFECDSPTWRVATIEKKIVYLCKSCFAMQTNSKKK